MSFLGGFHIAVQALSANALRTSLTTLGIVIGVAALIVMLAVGRGTTTQIADQIRSLGSNLLLVQPGSTRRGGVRLGAGSQQSLSEEDANAIAHAVPSVQVAAPTVVGRAQLVRGNRNWSTLIGGVTPDYLVARDWRVERGRAFTFKESNSAAKVVLIGATVVQRLFEDEDPLGQTVRIANAPFTVVGVLGQKGHDAASRRDQDDVALVPLSTAKFRVLGGRNRTDRRLVDFILVKVAEASTIATVQREIRALLRQRHRLMQKTEDDFELRDPAEALAAHAEASQTFSALLGGIGLVSLLVGGIGVMNVMLVSIAERTREIGIRLAVGARRRDVCNQFLIESLTLCAAGGLGGIALGTGMSFALAYLAGWPVLIDPVILLVGLGFACASGILFGTYPALRAARLAPIEALRRQ